MCLQYQRWIPPVWVYSQFSLKRAPLGQALSVRRRKCPSYRESNRKSKERQGPTLGIRFTGVRYKSVGHLELVPAFLYSLFLTLYKMDIPLKQSLSACPKGVHVRESLLYTYPVISSAESLRPRDGTFHY